MAADAPPSVSPTTPVVDVCGWRCGAAAGASSAREEGSIGQGRHSTVQEKQGMYTTQSSNNDMNADDTLTGKMFTKF